VNRTTEAIHEACQGQDRRIRDEIPFSSQQGWSALVFAKNDMPGTYVLGAPEVISPWLVSGIGLEKDLEEWRSQGRRALLFCYYPEIVPLREPEDESRMPDDLTPLCLLNFCDELRAGVGKTLRGFSKAGIRP